MPRIDLVPQASYQPLQPYYYLYDQQPLNSILTQIQLVNYAVDIASDQLRNCAGTAGTVDNRLSQSLQPSGALITSAVDATLHNIGAHTDGSYNGISYVRYTQPEQAKLANIASGATNISIQFDTVSTPVILDSGLVEMAASDGINWYVSSPNVVTPNLTFSTNDIHRHYYSVIPVAANSPADYQNYYVAGSLVQFTTGSLRIYVNGFRLSPDVNTPVPLGVSRTLTNLSYNESSSTGGFSLSTQINSTDVIVIDYDLVVSG